MAWNRHKVWLWGMSCTGLSWARSLWATSSSVCCVIWWYLCAAWMFSGRGSCFPNLQTLLLVSCTPLELTETNPQVLVSAFSSFLLYPFCGSWKHLVFFMYLFPQDSVVKKHSANLVIHVMIKLTWDQAVNRQAVIDKQAFLILECLIAWFLL